MTSLPVPVSPWSNTVESVCATRRAELTTRDNAGLEPTKELSDTSDRVVAGRNTLIDVPITFILLATITADLQKKLTVWVDSNYSSLRLGESRGPLEH